MSENKDLLTTGQKALTVNLDPPVYGTFAEIGAGQEVAREFFQAGAALRYTRGAHEFLRIRRHSHHDQFQGY
jgi:hypothetical protein